MSVAARRSLPTAVAATVLLAGLWFIPSAHATADLVTPAGADRAPSTQGAPVRGEATSALHAPAGRDSSAGAATGSGSSAAGEAAAVRAAESGDTTTPYLIGGTLVLGLGAGFVVHGRRLRRTRPAPGSD